ncbi:MAG: hypothetical protein ACI90V_013782, partial [Bacillariaceae sp.]
FLSTGSTITKYRFCYKALGIKLAAHLLSVSLYLLVANSVC